MTGRHAADSTLLVLVLLLGVCLFTLGLSMARSLHPSVARATVQMTER